MKLEVDHLVIGAASLDAGVLWCEHTLGVTPGPGGRHARFGTHNRLLSIASPAFARAYFEIIAIDPDAAAPGQSRWFDLDDPALARRIVERPRLIHWVARCDDIDAACAEQRAQGIDPGEVIAAERATPQGTLRWRITVRADGRRLAAGAMPTLIAWPRRHPTDAMSPSGVTLVGLHLAGLPEAALAWLPPGVSSGGAVPLTATLDTPRGRVVLAA